MLRILLGPLRRKKICPILFLSLLTLPLLSLSSYYYNKNVLPLMILRLLIVSLLILCGLLSSHKVLSMGTVIALIEIIFLETSSATALHTLWWLVTTTLQLTELAYLQIMIIHRMESHDPTKTSCSSSYLRPDLRFGRFLILSLLPFSSNFHQLEWILCSI